MKLIILGDGSSYLESLLKKTNHSNYIIQPLFDQHVSNPSMAAIREVRPKILKWLARHPQYTVLGLGGTALKFILDIGSQSSVATYRGRPVTLADTKRQCYVTYDPASVLRGNMEHEALLIEDLERFHWKQLSWPKNCFPVSKIIGVDTEYKSDGSILDLAVADSSNAYSVALNDTRTLKKVFAVPKIVAHVLGGDLTNLIKLGCTRNDWAQGKNIKDSFIISRLADENRGRGNYTVDALLLAKHNVKGWKHKTEAFSDHDATEWPTDLRAERCRLDAWAGLHVSQDWQDKVEGPVELQTQIACTLERIKLAGAYVDLPAFEKWATEVKYEHTKQLNLLTRFAWKHGLKEFSPTTPNDIRQLLFKKLRIQVEEYTKTGLPAVTKAFLYRHKHDIPAVAQILSFRQIDKLLTTYVNGIRKKIIGEKLQARIPFRLGAMGTRTGRRAADKPNSQNWTKSARAIIHSRWPGGLVLDNDFSKLEIILLAYEAQDDELMHYFTKEKNGYISIGTKLFNKTVEEGTSEYRQIKAVVLGVNYNLQSYGLARQLWDLHGVRLSKDYDIHTGRVDEVRKKYLRMFPRIGAYQRERIHEVHKYGSALCWFGQLRRLPIPAEPSRSEGKEVWKAWRRHVAHLENEAINARIQTAASYVTGTAMLDTESALLKYYGYSHVEYHCALAEGKSKELNMPLLINEVHDDLVYDCPKKELRHAQPIIKECMTQLRTLKKLIPEFDAPVRVNQTAASHWGLKE